MNDELFRQPTLHVFDHVTLKPMFTEVFAQGRWFDDGEVFARGPQQYRVEKQEKGVQHYYVFVTKLES